MTAVLVVIHTSEGPDLAPLRRHPSVQAALEDPEGGDVLLLDGRALLAPGWAERLVAAAAVDDRVATASPWVLPVGEAELAARAADVERGALRSHPLLSQPAEACVLLRRVALELVGWPAEEDPRAALREFARRCTATGLLHVLADDLLVGGAGAEGPDPAEGDAALGPGPLGAAGAAVRRALTGMSVTVDARSLDGPLAGTQVHVLGLLEALVASADVRVRVLVGPEPGEAARALLATLDVEVMPYAAALGGVVRSDVVHRPQQVHTVDDLNLLRLVGERIVVTHHDSILFHDPAYFATPEQWRAYRQVTRLALGTADRTVFITELMRREAIREELVEPGRAVVVPNGTDHVLPAGEPARPPAMGAGEDGPFLLYLGSDLEHKNRPFAIAMARAMRERGWEGRLVLAGGSAAHGSSAARERALLDAWPGWQESVVSLGHVSEAEREWLTGRCSAVVFPSVSEGFGLPPFEAARRGVPALFAHVSAMAELLPEAAATIVPWDVDASAAAGLALLRDERARAEHLRVVGEAAERFTWRRTAGELTGVYEQAARGPSPAAAVLAADLGRLHGEVRDLRAGFDALSEDALGLIGPQGVLPPEIQRAILAAAVRPATRRPLFAALRLAYRASRWKR